MRVRFLSSAADDLEAIGEHIARDRPRAAEHLISTIRRSTRRIAETGFADMFRAGRRRGTRELVMGRYVVCRYGATADEIVVLSVVHGARRA